MGSKKLDAIEEDVKEFMLECTELLNQAEVDLLNLDRGGVFEKSYSSIFRVFHSLKGGAGMFGLSEMNQHMHHLENDLTKCGAKKSITHLEISYFLKGVDAAKKILFGDNPKFNFDDFNSKIETPEVELKNITPLNKFISHTHHEESHGKIMIIDDEIEITEILKEILISAKFDVFSYTSAILALKDFKAIKPDMVITDMKMPEMSGLDVLKKVKELDIEMPVIYISGHLDKKTLLDSISIGIYAAIEKPYKEAEVISTAVAALKISKMFKLVGRSINLMLYQFAELEDFMKQKGQHHQAKLIKSELESLISYRKSIRDYKKAS
ncbi:MAG: response regulator [Bacteriovoracaceae bacterium]|nr:response regulator [Bacteriovoracaceae bacterium]